MDSLLSDKLNPLKLGFSPFMAAVVGAIIEHDYGVRDRKGGRLTGLSITSDGFVVASSTAHESGALLGSVDDLDRNLALLLQDADLDREERKEFAELYQSHVADWRPQPAKGVHA